jgi:hypothetical protein
MICLTLKIVVMANANVGVMILRPLVFLAFLLGRRPEDG